MSTLSPMMNTSTGYEYEYCIDGKDYTNTGYASTVYATWIRYMVRMRHTSTRTSSCSYEYAAAIRFTQCNNKYAAAAHSHMPAHAPVVRNDAFGPQYRTVQYCTYPFSEDAQDAYRKKSLTKRG